MLFIAATPNGTNEEAPSAVTEEIAALGAPVHAVLGSVAEAAVCDALVACCVDNFVGIDVMVNNTGIVRDRTLLKRLPALRKDLRQSV